MKLHSWDFRVKQSVFAMGSKYYFFQQDSLLTSAGAGGVYDTPKKGSTWPPEAIMDYGIPSYF